MDNREFSKPKGLKETRVILLQVRRGAVRRNRKERCAD